MNSGCYRVIFNKARGMLMVVSEAARSQGKTGNPSVGGSAISQVAGGSQTDSQLRANGSYQGGRLNSLRAHLLLALGMATIISSSAYADSTKIVADRNAAANQQAIILKSSNGTTQVNIQTPSAAGVSRNVFSQFDVGLDGAVLNNSRTNAQTQLAGWVEGNSYLARGEAKVILNEVNSSDPSRLTGFTEIAGGRAELIIANPAGITCTGCGFINASRTTLTTGNALMDQGKLTGFDVTGGKVRIDGDGLDTSGSDYTQILAKTSEINAAVYAKNLDVIIGSNKVSYEADAQDTVITSANNNASNTTTGVALDVSALGAMYAGKIRLIGTDKGMGVTNAGSIIASSGGLQLDNDGNLINSGSLVANQGKVDIATKGFSVDNSGTIASSRDTIALDSIALNNSGVISSYDALTLQQTGTINNSGEIVTGSFNVKAAALNNTGTLLQTGKGKLAIDTQSFVNQQQAIVGQDLYITDTTTPPTVTPSKKPPTTATNGSSVNTDDGTTQSPEPNPTPLPMITRDGNISVNSLTNTGSTGVIYTNAAINIAADSVVNKDKSSLAVNNIAITTKGSVANNNSRLQLDEINWQLADFDNNKGQLLVTKGISITSADKINNTQGSIAAVGDINLSAQNKFINNKGSVQSNATIVTRSSELDNTQGTLSSQGNLNIDSDGILTNNKGRIQTDQNLQINAKGYTNTDGTIIGVKRANIDVFDDINIDNSSNNIQAGSLTLSTQGRFSNTGKLSGQNALTINAQRIDNQKGAELISNGTTALNATTDINNRGLINGVNTYLKADKSVNNYSNGRIYGDHVAIAATTLNNTPDVFTKTKVDYCTPGPGCSVQYEAVYSDKVPPIQTGEEEVERLGIKFTVPLYGPNSDVSQEWIDTHTTYNRSYYKVTSEPAPVIAARERLDIGVINLNNKPNKARAGVFNQDFNGQAQIISNGELHIGGSLGTNHQATGQANTVTNKGASIESVGDMSISTNKLNNVNADFKIIAGLLSTENVTKWRFVKDNQGRLFDPSDLLKDSWDYYVKETGEKLGEDYRAYDYVESVHKDKVVISDAAKIISGGNLYLSGDLFNNDKSTILAGETQKIYGEELINNNDVGLLGREVLSQDGSYQLWEVHYHGAGSKKSLDKINGPVDYSPAPNIVNNYKLNILDQAIDKTVIAHDITDNDNQQIIKTPTDEIRSSDSAPTLPNSSLYGVNPDSNAEYLIETDPAFANYKNWLSSSYMLDRLKLDPNITQKRLGDGYYEQQYIRDQIMMLTGRYYLGDYRNQDAQYQGLMDAGVTTAQTLNLRPGIALTDAQVATLTTDIVWLVQQNITLADGSIQKVLVPKVYTRQAVGQIDGTGNLIAAEYLYMQLTGDLNNKGNIVGHQSLNINANNLTNADGGLIKGNFVQISTKNDLNNLSATISANSAMQLDVGGDVNNKSLTYSTESVKGDSNATRTGIAQIASIYVGDGLKGQTDENGNALTTFVANVGGDTTFAAGRLDNLGGSSFINTTGDVKLDAVNVGYQTNSIGDANNYFNEGASSDIGSQLNGNNDIIVKGNNVSGIATQISSNQGTVGIIADGNVDFKEGRSKQNLSTAFKTTDKGFLSKTTTQDRYDMQSDQAINSNIEGNQVFVQAGNNISLTGTNAISDRGTQLTAGGNIDILAAKNTSSESSESQEKKSGMFSTGGASLTIGKQQTDESNTSTSLTHTASNVAALDGNLIISAGGKYQQTGSNIIAGMGADSDKDISPTDRGNTVIRAQQINADNALDVYTNQSETKFKQSGLTVSVSNSLVDSAKSIDSLIDAGGNTDSVRMKGMAVVAGALKAKALAAEADKAAQGLLDNGINADSLKGLGNTRIQATIGSQKSQSNSSSYTEVNQGSSINTNNLALIATGAGTDSNISVNGSNLNVTNNALFQADNDFNVNGVAQNSNTRSTNKSSSTAIGAYASTNVGQGASAGITASGSRAKGYANSDSVTYANSQINVGGTTTLDIGNDVNIKGGVFNTDKVQGRIKGNVNIESLQDTATYDSNQKNMGFTLDVDLKGAGSSLSLNGGKTNVNADYKAVGEQSGIFTGDGGFDLVVDGKTTLIGGAITTTDKALELGLNKYVSKGGITTQDIENTSSYKGDAISVGVSLGMTDNKPQGGSNGLGYGTDSDSDSSITKAGITGIAGNSGITTDNQVEYAGALENVFDATRVNEELGAQVEITQAFDQERRKIKTEINKKEKNLRDEADKQDKLGNTVGRDNLRLQADKVQNQGLLFDAISGAIYGPNTNGVTGYVAKVASPFVANQIGQYFKQNEVDNKIDKGDRLEEGSVAHLLAHTILGAAVSYATGNDAVSGGIAAGTGEVTAPLLSQFLYGTTDSSKLTAEQKDTISAITSALGLGIGATTGNASDAANAAETNKVAVDNNHSSDIRVAEKAGTLNVPIFSNSEALAIKAVIGTMVWPVGVLEAYLAADNDAEKLAILKTAFSPLKARALLEILENTQVAKSRANKPSNQTANRAGKTCSFRGDMLVKTISGYRPISEVQIGNMVLSKNEITGKLTYQSISNHYNNSYNATVYITIKDTNGNTQTIVSNKIHPFFTQVNTGAQLPQSSEGHNYRGNIDNAQWIDASNLKAGYQLLSEDGQWQVVQSVRQTDEPLSAYNLTVDNDHTYFVTGSDSTYGVWVHNNCWSSLPDGAELSGKTLPNGTKLYQYKEDGKIKLLYQGKDGRYYDKNVYKPDDLKAQQGAKENKPPEHISDFIDAPPTNQISGFKGLIEVKGKTRVQGGGKIRDRWKDKKGRIYEWDYQHGEIEKYDKLGNHMGAFNPKTGTQIKPAIKNRKVEP